MTKKKAKPPLSDTHPTIANEADGWDPKLFHADGYSIKKWKCNLGHIYQVEIISRTRKNQGCPYCSGHRVLAGFNDLATTHPELTKEIIDGDPTKFTRGSDTRFTWICSNKHTWKTSIGNRALRGTGCPTCYEESRGFIGKQRREANIKKANLKTEYPEIAAEAYGWDPLSVPSSSEDKLLWKCKFGHIWSSKPYYRTRKNQKCKICTGQEILSGFNDLAALYPAIAKQMLNNDPSKVSKASQKKYTWVCSDNHQWEATVANRVNRGSGCPVCAGKKVVAGENDLAAKYPEIAAQAYGWDPKKFTPNSNKRKKWTCSLGHEWVSSIANRTKQGLGCPTCSNQKVLSGFNDLATVDPKLAREAYGWDPKTVTRGSNKKRKWKCSEGHIWSANIANRSGRGDGCPTCNAHGFDPNENAWLYLLEHDSWEMLQIGITNDPDARTRKHKKLGWKIIELRGPSDGHSTQQWETAILRMLKAKGADLSNEKIAGKFDGYSEAWSKSKFEANSIKELMKLTEEYEEEKSVTNLSHRKTKKDKN